MDRRSNLETLRPVTGAELLTFTKVELVRVIKALAADKTPAEIRILIEEIKQQRSGR